MLYLDTFGAAGGVGRCSLELIPALARRLGGVTLAGRSHVVDSYGEAFGAKCEVRLLNLELPRFAPGALALRLQGKLGGDSAGYTESLLARAGVREKNDAPVVINYPQELEPPRKTFGFDIFVHDLNWRHYGANFGDPDKLDRRCREWSRQARRIFTNSEFTRSDVLEAYGIKAEKVIAAPLAPPTLMGSLGDPEKVRRFGLEPGGYFFYPAAHGLHKGHDVLADALAGTAALPVVITAPLKWEPARYPTGLHGYLRRVTEKLGSLERAGKIVALAGLPWSDLLLLAANCRAYVLPSRFEGYGFPLVEAMALGKFSICSDIPAFREILDRYGSQIRAAPFRSGDVGALRDLLGRPSSELPGDVPPAAKFAWTWSDTARVMAEAF